MNPFDRFPALSALRCACLLVLLSSTPLTARAQKTPGEYDIKAVFLFNFTRFVEWPAAQGEDADKPLIIAVLGDDPFGVRLDEAVRGETAGGRELVLKRIHDLDEAGRCDALFIARSEKPQVHKILARLKGRPILTVSDIPDFAAMGGMVELVTDGGKIRLHINVDESKAAQLTISSKLLRPAQIVSTRKTSRHPHRARSLFAAVTPPQYPAGLTP